jgi:pimeloyl-ACP methyl ester carboxylesterase
MAALPGQLLALYLFGLLATGVLAAALYLLLRHRRSRWVVAPRGSTVVVDNRRRELLRPRGRAEALAVLAALLMLAWVLFGRYAVAPFFPKGDARPNEAPPSRAATVDAPSGARLAVRHYGSGNGPVLVLTHGWGADQREWTWLLRSMPSDTRMVTWDLPGLGASTPPRGKEYSLPQLAGDLDAVVGTVKDAPVVLVGHSVGGMINIEYARQHGDRLGQVVRGMVQANTTFTNPLETMKNADRSRAMQKPVYEPLLHLVSAGAPVFRALGWLAYQSGLAHLQLAQQSFSGGETWQQLDEMARYAYRSSPDVMARGVLAMLRWDGSDALVSAKVPTLIISGEQDVTTLPVASDKMEREMPMARRVRISPAAHMGPVEQERRYAQAMSAFTSGLQVAQAQ